MDTSQLQGKLSASTYAALMSHLGVDVPVTQVAEPAPVKETRYKTQKDDATQGLDVSAYEHDRNINAGVDEDFGMSQFWYTKETSIALAKEALSCGGKAHEIHGIKRIAFVSCPSAFTAALELYNPDDTEIYVFEYDTRFGDLYGDQFAFFDYNHPHRISEDFHGVFDYVMADPPYLEDVCMQKTVQAMKILARDETTPMSFNTGSVMCDSIYQYAQFRESKFHPEHKSKLGNEFSCFTNYLPEQLGGWYDIEEKDIKKDSFLPAYYKHGTAQ